MPSRHLSPRLPWTALAAFAWAGAVRADLAPSSPFLPANSAAAGQAAPAGPVELRGIMGVPGGFAYCIYDTAKKTSTWVGLNERGNDFIVKSADPAKESVTVDFQGRSLQLVLRTAKVASSGAAAGPQAAPAVASSVVLNPSMADEQRRLDAVAQEVRRRRLERERAVQNTVPGPAVTPAPGPNR
jgi:hypothetical protein